MSYKIGTVNEFSVFDKGENRASDAEIYGADFVDIVKFVDMEKRLLTITATTEARDRDGDIISAKGWLLDNYKKNPVFLWAHNYMSVPLAAAVKIARKRSPWRIDLTHRFPTKELNPFADMILGLYYEKIINAGSVGFIPYEWEKIEDDETEKRNRPTYSNRKYLQQELLEHSGCAIPSNPEALQNFVKNFNIKNIAKSGDRVFKYLSGEEPLKLKQRTEENILSEIGEIIVGKKPARSSNDEITAFDSTGLAIQDAATVDLLYKKARAQKIGHYINF